MTEKILVLTDTTIENYFDYCLEIKFIVNVNTSLIIIYIGN